MNGQHLLAASGQILMAAHMLCAIDWQRPASDRDLAFVTTGPGHDAVHEDPVVGHEVGRFSRLPHHRQPEVPVEQQRLDRAQPRCPVAPYGSDKDNSGAQEPLSCSLGQPWGIILQVGPTHEFMLAEQPPMCRRSG